MEAKAKMELKIGVVGCGNIAKVHLRYILQYINKSNIALCDTDVLRLDEFAKPYAIENRFTDLSTMLSGFKPDIVHVLTPPLSHKSIAIMCLNGGSHVLIEKPVCVSLAEMDEISNAARDSKKMVCVDHMRLFDPDVLKAQAIIESGKIGDIVNISAAYSYDYFKRVDTDPATRWIKKLPGGVFFDIIPHPLCIVDKFLPGLKLVKSVTVPNNAGLENELWCIFTSSARTATLHMSLNVNPLVNYVEIECTRGIIKIDLRNFLLIIRKNFPLPNAIERIVGNLDVGLQITVGTLGSVTKFLRGKLDPYAGMKTIIENFYRSALNNGESPVPLNDARRLLEMTTAMFFDKKSEVEGLRPLPGNLQEADVLVTGGTGFIGRRLVNRLLDDGCKVRVLSHRDIDEKELQKTFKGHVELVKGDIYYAEDVLRACYKVKKVFHLAAAMQGGWNYHLDTTITGMQNILNGAAQAGVEQFIYVSTINVYDAKRYPRNGIINEDFDYEDSPEKRGSYSHAKLRAEKIIRQFAEKTPMGISIIRPGLVYGPCKSAFLGDIGYRVGRRAVIVLGNGFRKLPLVYVDNLVDALVLAARKPGKTGRIFNVIDREYPTQRAYIREYNQLTNERLIPLYVPLFLITAGFLFIEKAVGLAFKKQISLNYKIRCISRNVTHSTERITCELGWDQKVDFKRGLALTVEATGKGNGEYV